MHQRIGESPIKQHSGGNPVLIEQQKTNKTNHKSKLKRRSLLCVEQRTLQEQRQQQR